MLKKMMISAALSMLALTTTATASESFVITERQMTQPDTVGPEPHRQTNQIPSLAQQDALIAQLRQIEGLSINDRPTNMGYHFDVTDAAKRFVGHMHYGQDGSIHVTMNPELAQQVISAGWGEPHPGYPFITLVYAPQTEAEIALVAQIVENAVAWARN